jgi:hypothetical protein
MSSKHVAQSLVVRSVSAAVAVLAQTSGSSSQGRQPADAPSGLRKLTGADAKEANPLRKAIIDAEKTGRWADAVSRPWTTKNDRGRTDFGTRPSGPSSEPPIGQCLHAFIFVQGREGRRRRMTSARDRMASARPLGLKGCAHRERNEFRSTRPPQPTDDLIARTRNASEKSCWKKLLLHVGQEDPVRLQRKKEPTL